jgi:hypothetical protein
LKGKKIFYSSYYIDSQNDPHQLWFRRYPSTSLGDVSVDVRPSNPITIGLLPS